METKVFRLSRKWQGDEQIDRETRCKQLHPGYPRVIVPNVNEIHWYLWELSYGNQGKLIFSWKVTRWWTNGQKDITKTIPSKVLLRCISVLNFTKIGYYFERLSTKAWRIVKQTDRRTESNECPRSWPPFLEWRWVSITLSSSNRPL